MLNQRIYLFAVFAYNTKYLPVHFALKKFPLLTERIILLQRLTIQRATPDLTEPELIQALQQRQQAAFKVLVETYKDRLYNTVLGFVQNFEDAEDIVQDVFIKVHEGIDKYRGEAKLATWLYRIAVTHSLDHLRRVKRRKRFGGFMTMLGVGANAAENLQDFNHPGIIAENKEKAAIMFEAIQQLPENQKAAFLLQKVEGLKQPDIAAILKVSEGAIESLLSRAKASLKKLLTEYYSS